ncbi:hypothetical protein KY290_031044 [Solanum tuberosum]|uniref:Integrase core domain containing protein n=1 Tax=Solanum tuberosum TaxID=4113 RepID=A0ABQ7U809_SOLTU|nr:hypothetical protein KY290_031044 [Solanum tuberosum]
MDLLTKHIMAGSKKVNVVGTPNRYEDQDIDLDEESKYLGNQRGFQNYNSRNQDGYRNDRNGVYMPPGNRDRASGSFNGSKLEAMLDKVL